MIQSVLVCIWGLRLGIFLIFRTLRDGHDSRFKSARKDMRIFFAFWTVEGIHNTSYLSTDSHNSFLPHISLQTPLSLLPLSLSGVWVWLTLLPTLIVNSKLTDKVLCTTDYIGWSVWLVGMIIECTADYQKYTFRNNPANK